MRRIATATLAAFIFLIAASAGTALAGPRLLVSNYAESSITIIDAELMEVVGEIPNTGNNPSRMVASPDESRVYVAVYGTGHVLAIDSSTYNIVGKVKVGDAAYAMDITPDGRYLVVGDFSEKGDISLVNTSTMKVVEKVKSPQIANGIRISPDGKTVFVTNGEGHKTQVFEVDGLVPVKELDMPQEVYEIKYSKDGSKIYFKSVNEQVIAVFDAATLEQTGRIPVYDIDGFTFSNDGKEIWSGGPEGSVTVYSAVDASVIARLDTGSRRVFQDIIFSPDGSRAFVSHAGENSRSIMVFDAVKKELIKEIKLTKMARSLLYLK